MADLSQIDAARAEAVRTYRDALAAGLAPLAALELAADVAFEAGRTAPAEDMERIERHARADELESLAAATLHRANEVRANVGLDAPRIDIVHADGTHGYFSTHCRHDRHTDCSAKWLQGPTVMDGVTTSIVRMPAQCKTCAAPCVCPCHQDPDAGATQIRQGDPE